MAWFMSKKNGEKKDDITKKIIKIYQNYGIDIADMSDEEFDRIKKSYINPENELNLDVDLEKSEKYIEKFKEDII